MVIFGSIQIHTPCLLPSSSLRLSSHSNCLNKSPSSTIISCCHRSYLISAQGQCRTSMNSPSTCSIHPFLTSSVPIENGIHDSGILGNGGNRNGNNNNSCSWWWWWWEKSPFSSEPDDGSEFPFPTTYLAFCLCSACLAVLPAIALSSTTVTRCSSLTVWEVRGGKWTRYLPDPSSDSFVGDGERQAGCTSFIRLSSFCTSLEDFYKSCGDFFLGRMLPEGYPGSVSNDYLEYSIWRGIQGIASQINGVLSTQALLYAIGLGKGAIPTAAALNWVLKDGIGYLSKIFLSEYGRHFDVNPKGWRLFADLLENAAYGIEILTPAFPQFFVLIGATAGAVRSAAYLIQAATRSCFYAGFAIQRNFAEVTAKGEAQGMVSKFLGITLGIALANYIGSSTSLALASFSVVAAVHMFCNLKSYQSIQLKTLNTYRASLVFSEYLWSGQVPSVKEVNDEEPPFTNLPFINIKMHKVPTEILSVEAKEAAAEICRRVEMGSKLSDFINKKEDANALFDLFRDENYLLVENRRKFCVILKEEASPEDMLKSLFHVSYLYWMEIHMGAETSSLADECRPGGRLKMSFDYVQREFKHVKLDGSQSGWLADGLIARPLTNRIRLGFNSNAFGQ
ncbi:hypothetical protein HPP92_011190 [Vanilla planifolia]|uniref:Protein root UVB sensitive 1, chloroplastic n=1 Tax=Vanilla planifolia TaxID=51239 RepID=A0A835R5K2_VANPL|nr:hypothetical protein HPP92_011190 [Vanilla planifolia]